MTDKPQTPSLDDATLLAQFENQTLDPVHADHLGHLRITWLYLQQHDVDRAAGRVAVGLKAYAESLGVPMKFHATITDALVRIMAVRVESMAQEDWTLFLRQNRDLQEDALSVLADYFSNDILFSETARTSLVAPDKKPIP